MPALSSQEVKELKSFISNGFREVEEVLLEKIKSIEATIYAMIELTVSELREIDVKPVSGHENKACK